MRQQNCAQGDFPCLIPNLVGAGPRGKMILLFNMDGDDDDNGQCPCSAIFLSISTQTSKKLCAIG
jgi:hypothetical protein